MTRERVTVEQVEQDPTNCYQVTVHGDVAVESLAIFEAGTPQAWTSIRYANGGGCAGEPAAWHTFVRITQEEQS